MKVNSGNILDISTAKPSDFKSGTYVEGEIYISYGCYATMEETTNYVFKRTSGYYYLIPVCYYDEDTGDFSDDFRYVGINVGSGDHEFFDELTDYTYGDSFTDPGTYKFKGKINSTGSEEEGYKMDFIKSGFTDEELQDPDLISKNYYELPYTIQIIKPADYLSMILIGAAILVVCAIIIVIKAVKSKNTISAGPSTSTPAGSVPPEFMTQSTYQPNGSDPFSGQNPFNTTQAGSVSDSYGSQPNGGDNAYTGQPNSGQGQPFVPSGSGASGGRGSRRRALPAWPAPAFCACWPARPPHHTPPLRARQNGWHPSGRRAGSRRNHRSNRRAGAWPCRSRCR